MRIAWRCSLRARATSKWFFDAFDNGGARWSRRRPPARRCCNADHGVDPGNGSKRNRLHGATRRPGRRVPDDLAIVGFDGLEIGAHTVPTLSTVSQPFDEIGESAARLVLAQLRGEPVEHTNCAFIVALSATRLLRLP